MEVGPCDSRALITRGLPVIPFALDDGFFFLNDGLDPFPHF